MIIELISILLGNNNSNNSQRSNKSSDGSAIPRWRPPWLIVGLRDSFVRIPWAGFFFDVVIGDSSPLTCHISRGESKGFFRIPRLFFHVLFNSSIFLMDSPGFFNIEDDYFLLFFSLSLSSSSSSSSSSSPSSSPSAIL